MMSLFVVLATSFFIEVRTTGPIYDMLALLSQPVPDNYPSGSVWKWLATTSPWLTDASVPPDVRFIRTPKILTYPYVVPRLDTQTPHRMVRGDWCRETWGNSPSRARPAKSCRCRS